MEALILVGGLGTRLESVTQGIPKALVDINGRPFLDILISYLLRFSIDKIVLCAGYKSEYVEEYARARNNSRHFSIDLDVSKEDTQLGTAGAIKNADKFISGKYFLVVNGDTFLKIDYDNFFAEIVNHNRFSLLAIAKRYDSKNITLAGSYLFRYDFMDWIDMRKRQSINDVLREVYKKNPLDIMFYGVDDRYIDIGTPDRCEYFRAHERDILDVN